MPSTSVHLDVSIDQIRMEKNPPFGDILIDLKMSQWNQYNPAENLKLLCYALVYREFYGRLPSQVGIWNVPFAKEGMFFTKVTEEMLTKATNTLGIMGRNIRQRKWNVPDGKRVCDGCRTKEMCSRPAESPTLKRLAYRNTEFKGHLPLTRSEIIAERILEKPVGKSIPEIVEQGELTFDSTKPSKMS